MAELIFACVLLAGCNIFSMAGILDGPPSGGSTSAPSTLKLLPDAVNVPVNGTRQFTATGGTPGYSYSVQAEGAGGSIDPSGLYTAPASSGTDTIVVTDSAGDTCESTAMVTASVSLSITPVTITLGAGATVIFTASGGTSPYTYSVSVGSGTINSGTGFFTAPPNAESDTVRVIDAASNTADAIVTVTNPPTLQISPATATLNAGATCTFTASGGVPPYSFSVTPPGTGTINPTTGLFTAPGVAETDTVVVADAGGGTRTASAIVTIVLPGGPLSINPSPASVDAGQTLSFTASGGTPPYAFSIVSGGGSINPSTGIYTAPLTGGTATVRVTDSAPVTLDSSVTINAPAPLRIAPTSLFLVTGGQTTFSATGGIPPYSYSVVTGGAGGTVTSGGLYTAPGVEGSDTVRVTDAGSRTSDAPVTVYFPLSIVPTDATVQQGDTYSFDASGGVPGAGYVYSQVSGVGTTDPDGTYHASGAAGSAVVKVVDSLNNSSTATVTVTAVVSWIIQSIDTSARSGQYASLALSSTGVPQIAYYESRNKELRLEKLIGSTWTRQTVDTSGTIGQYASLALDAGANARISYYDATNKRLRFASWNGSSWTKQTVDSGGDLGKYSSLALDSTGKPHISYYDSGNKDLKYASWNGSSWGVPQTVDSGGDVGMYTSLALEPGTNYPRISYYDNTNKDLKYASWNGSSWTKQTVDSGGDVGMYNSLALEPGTNYPRISYYQNDAGNNKHLKYASWNGTSWGVPQTVDPSNNVGMYSSLRYDPTTGKMRIAYYNSSSQDLKYAKEQ